MLNDSKLFEKIEIDWFCEDDLLKRINEYRPFYADIVKEIIQHKDKIRTFMKQSKQNMQTKRHRHIHTVKTKTRSTRRQ